MVDEINMGFRQKDQLGVKTHQNLVAVVIDAIVHGNEVFVRACPLLLADVAKGGNRLGDALRGDCHVVAANQARQDLFDRVIAPLVRTALLIDAYVEIAVVVSPVAGYPDSVMQLAQDNGNLQEMETRQALVALRALLLIRIGILPLRSGSRVRVALAQVVRVDASVRQRQKLELDSVTRGRILGVDALKVGQGGVREKIVVRDALLFAEGDHIGTVIGQAQPALFLLNIRRIRAKIFIYGFGRPGSCAGIGAVFFCLHKLTSLIRQLDVLHVLVLPRLKVIHLIANRATDLVIIRPLALRAPDAERACGKTEEIRRLIRRHIRGLRPFHLLLCLSHNQPPPCSKSFSRNKKSSRGNRRGTEAQSLVYLGFHGSFVFVVSPVTHGVFDRALGSYSR